MGDQPPSASGPGLAVPPPGVFIPAQGGPQPAGPFGPFPGAGVSLSVSFHLSCRLTGTVVLLGDWRCAASRVCGNSPPSSCRSVLFVIFPGLVEGLYRQLMMLKLLLSTNKMKLCAIWLA
jgi:hypothetical protein